MITSSCGQGPLLFQGWNSKQEPWHSPLAASPLKPLTFNRSHQNNGLDSQDQGLGLDPFFYDDLLFGEQMLNAANWMNLGSSSAMANDTVVQMPATTTVPADQMSTAIQTLSDDKGYDPSLNTSYLGVYNPGTGPASTYQEQQGQTLGQSAQYVGDAYTMTGGDQLAQYVQPVNGNGDDSVSTLPDNDNDAARCQAENSTGVPDSANGAPMQPDAFNGTTTDQLFPWEVSTQAYEILMRTENKVDKLMELLCLFKDPKKLKKFLDRVEPSIIPPSIISRGTSSTLSSSRFAHRRTHRSPGCIPKLVRNPPRKQEDYKSAEEVITAYSRKLKADKAREVDMTRSNECTMYNMKLDNKLKCIAPTDTEDSNPISSPALSTATILNDEQMGSSTDGDTTEKTAEKTTESAGSNNRPWKYYITLPSNTTKPENNKTEMATIHAKLLARSDHESEPWNGVLSDIEAVSDRPFSQWQDVTGTLEKIYSLFKDNPGVSIEMCKFKNQGNVKVMVQIPHDAEGKAHEWTTIRLSFLATHMKGMFAQYNVRQLDIEIWETNFELVVV